MAIFLFEFPVGIFPPVFFSTECFWRITRNVAEPTNESDLQLHFFFMWGKKEFFSILVVFCGPGHKNTVNKKTGGKNSFETFGKFFRMAPPHIRKHTYIVYIYGRIYVSFVCRVKRGTTKKKIRRHLAKMDCCRSSLSSTSRARLFRYRCVSFYNSRAFKLLTLFFHFTNYSPRS